MKYSIVEVKEEIKKRGNQFRRQVISCKDKVAKLAHPFISDRSVILVNSKSTIVYKTLCEAAQSHKRFTVFVTQSSVDNSGEIMLEWLKKKGIECNLILDSAIGYYMEKVDLVLTGAEGVLENGGIINKIGTYPLALCAKAMNKPFYVLVESFKFARLYLLNQDDIPQRIKCKHSANPIVDYTPPAFITLLLTNLGSLTTAAVSDVLMQLYL
ncbi:translation initiation factor eIF-2B subunit alpha-like protein [Leptotrombidium deliense]|uniref:Translation initiation factor eIF-2B subunit alpha-like protein n=1 Tax=Leptotrombidium deliense TaxID=299467 RepID=A0A443RZ96_9ACAR|nr:translation initiation factor eIF-2B subunit alpha-like protein [Leptotrombidium deliense]